VGNGVVKVNTFDSQVPSIPSRQFYQLERLLRAVDSLYAGLEPLEVSQRIVDNARELTGADYALIWPYDPEQKRFFPDQLVGSGISQETLTGFREREPAFGQTTRRVLDRTYVPVENILASRANFLGPRTRTSLRELGIVSFQGVRLGANAEPVGVLFVDYAKQRSFSDEDEQLLRAFADRAAVALRRARLLDQLRRISDSTGLVVDAIAKEDLVDTLKTVAEHTQRLLNADAVTIYSYDAVMQRFGDWWLIGADRKSARPPEYNSKHSAKDVMLNGADWHMLAEGDDVNHPFLLGNFVEQEQIRSAMGIKLTAGGYTVGVMFINYRTRHRFSRADIETARVLANEAAVAIRSRQLLAHADKRSRALQGLYDSTMVLVNTLSPDAILDRLAEQALRVVGVNDSTGACFSHVALRVENKLRFVAASSAEVLEALRSTVSEIDLSSVPLGVVGRVAITKSCLNIGNVPSGSDDYIDLGFNTHSQLSVPLKAGETVLGVISVEHSEEDAFSTEDIRNLEALAGQAALAIQHAERVRDLEQLNGLVGSRTAVDWMQMVSVTWNHTIWKWCANALENLYLLKKAFAKGDQDEVERRVNTLQSALERIKETPIQEPLSRDHRTLSVGINGTVKKLLEAIWKNPPYQSVTLCLDLQPELDSLASVRASPAWIGLAVRELVENALGAMLDAETRSPTITVRTALAGSFIMIRVCDNGPGIPSSKLSNLFSEPVEKPVGSRGAGLGLVETRIIAEMYRGDAYLESTGDTGTTMTIKLPVETPEREVANS
jgi:GAF domain-containing protein